MRKFGLLLILIISGCTKEPEWKSQHYVKHNLLRSVDDLQLPESLWKKMLGEKEDEKHKIWRPPSVEMKPITVYLAEKNAGILGGQNHKIEFGPGGGELDLRDFVEQRPGTFYVAFELIHEASEKAIQRVFFLSNNKQKNIEGLNYGVGCNTYLDITTQTLKFFLNKGFIINASDARHVHALSGTYFIISEEGGVANLAHVTFKDSRYVDRHCHR